MPVIAESVQDSRSLKSTSNDTGSQKTQAGERPGELASIKVDFSH